ncbi:hypothetical protein F3Y22_tig00110332pilonHSYRG00700 [Hibiscus syriacus]|uniref:DC1 domain-containing protein n=1 Tax=Hibiscus syriacus TaxID=106335 RepID=A0A6A3AZZ8_HIBSY|nr:hypothetical protein F3Y22_tig00110332pilonHSYRG00700 [Hibiscus syriacus]
MCEELNAATLSSITRVIEVNEDGEATKIEHFSHGDHCLVLADKMEEEEQCFLMLNINIRKPSDCKICFEEMKLERGSCSCVKAATQSYITHVIEENEDGEATKIEHFLHEGHCLVLADKMEEETGIKCDGCMPPVSTLQVYSCSESDCHFCLHKNCAELPKINQLWFRQSNATLQSKSLKRCDLCRRNCSGLFYRIGGYFHVCIRCAKVGDIIEGQAHQHFLFFDFKCKDQQCHGCGNDWHWYGAFRCGKCKVDLDFACLTLTHSTLHKPDEHKLYLTYHDDNDYSNHYYCDISEGERDQSL